MERELIDRARHDMDFLIFRKNRCVGDDIIRDLCYYLERHNSDNTGENIIDYYKGFYIKFDFQWDCSFDAYNIEILTEEEYEAEGVK